MLVTCVLINQWFEKTSLIEDRIRAICIVTCVIVVACVGVSVYENLLLRLHSEIRVFIDSLIFSIILLPLVFTDLSVSYDRLQFGVSIDFRTSFCRCRLLNLRERIPVES